MNSLINRLRNNIIFLNLVPLIFNAVLVPVYIISIDLSTMLFPFVMFINALLVPIYLFAINILYYYKRERSIIVDKIVLMFLSAICGVAIEYFGWGTCGGDIFNPDWLTKLFFELEVRVSGALTLAGGISAQVFLIAVRRRQNRAQ